MTTTIREINPRWHSHGPSDATNVSSASVGAEKQLRWGIGLEGGKSGIGFAGTSPPAQQLDLGQEFDVGTLRYFNTPISGVPVGEVTLELEFVYQDLSSFKFDLELEIDNTSDGGGPPGSDDVIETKKNFPITIDVKGTKFDLLGFRVAGGGIEDEIRCAEDATTSATLVAQLISTPKEEEHCIPGEFDPVFNPDRCTVPPVCPISPELIIEDCGIPEAPPSMTDCPEIDIPAFAGIADAGPAGPGEPGPPGEPGAPGCTPQITVSYSTYYVHDCHNQGITAATINLPPCDVHIHFTLYICKPYYAGHNCCVYVCCNGVWTLLDGGDWCQGYQGGTTTTTPYPQYDGPQIITAPQSDCTEDGVVQIKCPCVVTTTPQRYCVEPPCGFVGGCRLMENIMDVTNIRGTCLCNFEDTATYDGSKWVANSTDCDGDYIALSCYSYGSGRWQFVVNCQGEMVTAEATVTDNGDNTCTFNGRFVPGENGLDACCPGSGSVNITFTGTKCQTATTTTQAPPDCVETDCSENNCSNIPGTISLAVGSGSACSWPTTAVYNPSTGCWEANSTDCDDGKISLCCVGGIFRATLTENGVTDTVTANAFDGGSCFINGTWNSPPFPADIAFSARYDWCDPDPPPPPPEGCIDAGCDGCGEDVINEFEARGTVTVTGGGCCQYDSNIDHDGGNCWSARELGCPDNTANIELCCDGPWHIGMNCNGGSHEEFPTITDNGDTCDFEVDIDSNQFGTECCSGTGTGDIHIKVTLTKCCSEERTTCYWEWVWLIPPDPESGVEGEGEWRLIDGDMSLFWLTQLCDGCICNTPPPIPTNPFEGQQAETKANCS